MFSQRFISDWHSVADVPHHRCGGNAPLCASRDQVPLVEDVGERKLTGIWAWAGAAWDRIIAGRKNKKSTDLRSAWSCWNIKRPWADVFIKNWERVVEVWGRGWGGSRASCFSSVRTDESQVRCDVGLPSFLRLLPQPARLNNVRTLVLAAFPRWHCWFLLHGSRAGRHVAGVNETVCARSLPCLALWS